MSGDPAILVDRYSAKSGRSWEDKPSHLHPINRSHSEMVQLPEHDEDCEVVLGKLKRFAELAPAVIRARWKDSIVVRPALVQDLPSQNRRQFSPRLSHPRNCSSMALARPTRSLLKWQLQAFQ